MRAGRLAPVVVRVAVLLGGKHGDATDSGEAIDVGEAGLGISRYLMFARSSTQLEADFVYLAKAGSADGFTVGQKASVGIDRDATFNRCLPVGHQLFLLAILTETAFGQMHDFMSGFRVLKLGHIDFVRSDTGHFKRRP